MASIEQTIGKGHTKQERDITPIKSIPVQLEEIRDMIAKDDLIKGIARLRLLVKYDTDSRNDAIRLSNRIYALKRRINHGTISWEDEREERNRIVASILDILEELEEDGF